MILIDIIKKAEGMKMADVDGNSSIFEFLPPASPEALLALEKRLPCPIPDDVRELLSYTTGLQNGPLDCVDFTGSLPFEHIDVFPHGLPIAHDGIGNFWVVDLTSNSKSWGPIFFACHEPPVTIYQYDNLNNFLTDVISFYISPDEDTDILPDQYYWEVWKKNPGVLSFEECMNSKDLELKAFAQTLDESYQFIDLRHAKIGNGFSWGRYGSNTVLKRYGEKRIFAYQTRKSWWKRLFN